MAAVEYLGIRELYSLHDLGERNSFRLDEKMNVVGHQDVGIHGKAVPPTIVFDPIEVSQPVLVVTKDLLALIAAHNNVIKCSFKFDSRFSGHDGDLL